jgi:hypothetical protein
MRTAEDTVVEMVLHASPYESPRGEASRFKGIPMEFYENAMMRRFIRSKRLKARFRGPRHDKGAQTCLKADATTFALYKREAS